MNEFITHIGGDYFSGELYTSVTEESQRKNTAPEDPWHREKWYEHVHSIC